MCPNAPYFVNLILTIGMTMLNVTGRCWALVDQPINAQEFSTED
jgi:hypothetical protein